MKLLDEQQKIFIFVIDIPENNSSFLTRGVPDHLLDHFLKCHFLLQTQSQSVISICKYHPFDQLIQQAQERDPYLSWEQEETTARVIFRAPVEPASVTLAPPHRMSLAIATVFETVDCNKQ